jgi:GTP-binding protein HflX
MWSHLERIAGGAATAAAAVGGIGTRGPGEKQIEIDRRLVQKRKSLLKSKLSEIDRRKMREVNSRDRAYCVCLVGYTNAGKSTLMNLLTGAGTYVADKLFATLETKTRRWQTDGGGEVLLSDTVGFVRDLPHHLVASFRATLEEAIYADLLIHVADASHERVDDEIAAVNQVLDELEIDHAQKLLVLNKVDKIMDPTIRTVLAAKYPDALFLSARTGEGADELTREVIYRCSGGPVSVSLEAHCGNGRLMQFLGQYANIESQTYEGAVARIEGTLPADRIDELRAFGDDVRIIEPAAT